MTVISLKIFAPLLMQKYIPSKLNQIKREKNKLDDVKIFIIIGIIIFGYVTFFITYTNLIQNYLN